MASNRRKLELQKAQQIRLARTDFLTFRKIVNPKAKWGWWQREIAAHLQQFYDDLMAGKRPKLVIQAPPQHGKSVQIIDFISWVAGKNPDLRTIYTSFSERLGIRANLRLQRLYDSAKYAEIFPATKINRAGAGADASGFSRNREILEYVGRDGFFRNTTVRGAITGEGLDLGVVDDPIKGRAEANSITARNGAWDWLTDDFFSRFADQAGLLCILTRWHIDDPIGRLLQKFDDIKLVSYPAIATEDEPHRKCGEALFPEHKPIDFLLERKAIMEPRNFEALYQQRPTVAEGNLFRPDQIPIIDAIPAGRIRWVRAWDFASSTDGDYTAGAKMGRLDDGRYIIADMVRVREGTDGRDRAIVNTASRDGRITISIPQDPGAAGKSQVAYLAKQLSGYHTTWSLESGDKTTRADPLASQANVGNVLMLRGPWNGDLINELREFPEGKNDDQVDALSRAFSHLMGGKTGLLDYMQAQAGDAEKSDEVNR